jgi:hypothetical protein
MINLFFFQGKVLKSLVMWQKIVEWFYVMTWKDTKGNDHELFEGIILSRCTTQFIAGLS